MHVSQKDEVRITISFLTHVMSDPRSVWQVPRHLVAIELLSKIEIFAESNDDESET